MKLNLMFLLIVLSLSSTIVYSQKLSASEFVESFYKFHRTNSRAFDENEVNLHKKWFSEELNQLLEHELKRQKQFLEENPTDKPMFGDGFPFLPMEECYKNGKEIKNVLKIGDVIKQADKTLVKIKFYYPKACGDELIHSYIVELIKNKKSWLINDWIFSDGEKLSEVLKRTDY